MKNKILLSLASIAVLSSTASSFDLQYKLDQLEQRIKSVESTKSEYISLQKEYMADMEEFDNKISELETASILNGKLRWGVYGYTTVNNFTMKHADGNSYKDNNLISSLYNFNAMSQIDKNLTFDATMSVYKNWGDSDVSPWNQMDVAAGNTPGDSSIYLTRAYFDWIFPTIIEDVPMALTVGRQPSQGGSSFEFGNNTQRKGTYSALAFDSNIDGLVYTANISSRTGFENNTLRVGYGKGYQNDSNAMNEYSFMGNDSTLKDTTFIYLGTAMQIPGVDKSLFQTSYVAAKNLVANPTIDADQGNVNIGDLAIMTAFFHVRNISDSQFDIFAHYSKSTATPSKNAFGGMAGLMNNANPFTGVYSPTEKTGSAYWVGARYNMENGMKVGFEYNSGDENWIAFNQGSADVYNKLAIRGNAMEAYAIYPFSRYASLKVGMVELDYKYTGSGMMVGAPQTINKSTMITMDGVNFSSPLKAVSNIYASFIVRF